MAVATDAELIAASLADAERFEGVFERHAASIHRYLRRRVGDRLAEELTAETFTRAFRARRQFDGRQESALPWLYGIAVNLIRMYTRSEERRRRAYRLSAAPDVQPATGVEDDARIDARAMAPALRDALAALTPSQREVLLLHAWAGLSPAEIAQALALPAAVVRKRLHRARTKAAARLGSDDVAPADEILVEIGSGG